MSNATHIALTVACEPHLARIVRMTAANVATLSSMSVERVEDIRMAAEEAFIYACGTAPGEDLVIDFDATPITWRWCSSSPPPRLPSLRGRSHGRVRRPHPRLRVRRLRKARAPARLALDMKADVDGI